VRDLAGRRPSTCTEIGNRRLPTPFLERTADAGFDAARNLVDSARIIAIADSTMRLTPEQSEYYITATFTRGPGGYLLTRSPNLPGRSGGGALVGVGEDGDAQVIYFTQ
jgi:hypothetical protein